jgi:hypothetical protein
LALAAGCSGPGVRTAEVWLGRNATIEVDGARVAANPDGPTRLEIPIAPKNTLRITEPRKAAIVERMTVLIDPPPDVEDRVVLGSTANTTVVHTGGKGGASGAAGPQALFPDPIARLRDPGGPWFCPPPGQGILLTTDDWRARVTVDRKFRFVLERAHDASTEHPWSKPLAIVLDPGRHTLDVARPGRLPFSAEIRVEPGEYAYLGVRLAEERRGVVESRE